jgi:AraC family transcriptional regulator, transcriptional activator of the genes for pyochelin and ferripyochelin receptors
MRRNMIKEYDIPAIREARHIIEVSIRDHICIPDLAEKCGLNEFKLKQGFRELYNTSPYKYLVHLRLQLARTLLEDTDLTINQIADRIGFESYNGFSTAFKKAYKLSPTIYRNFSHPTSTKRKNPV